MSKALFSPVPACFSGEPFTAADIIYLAQMAEMPIASGVDPARLAIQLGRVFRNALDWVAMTAGEAPREDALLFYKSVAHRARALLEVLELPREPQQLLAMSNDEIDVAPGMVRLRASGPWDFGVAREVALQLARRGGMSSVATGPFAIARLCALADGAVRELEAKRPKRGARPDNFAEVLFNGLAWFHRNMFGEMPRIDGEDRGDRQGSGVVWARAALFRAADKIPPVLVPGHSAPEVGQHFVALEIAAIEGISGLSPVTVADRLAGGMAFVRQNLDAAS